MSKHCFIALKQQYLKLFVTNYCFIPFCSSASRGRVRKLLLICVKPNSTPIFKWDFDGMFCFLCVVLLCCVNLCVSDCVWGRGFLCARSGTPVLQRAEPDWGPWHSNVTFSHFSNGCCLCLNSLLVGERSQFVFVFVFWLCKFRSVSKPEKGSFCSVLSCCLTNKSPTSVIALCLCNN